MAETTEKTRLGKESPRQDKILAWSLRITKWALVGFVAFDPVSISIAQICVVIGIGSGVIAWILGRRLGSREGFSPEFPLLLPLLIFAVLTVLSALFSEDIPRSIVDCKQLFQILILFWTLGAAPDATWIRRLVQLFILVAVVVAIVGMVQFLLKDVPALARRPRGTLSHFQTFSGVLLLASIPALSLAVGGGIARGERVFGAAASFILILGLLVSLTRGAWIGLAVGVILLLVLHGRAKWLWFLPVVAIGLFIVGPKDLRERLLQTVRFEEKASGERLRMWKSGLRMIQDHPFLGVGVDMIKPVYPRYRLEGVKRQRTGHLHSNPINVAAERGLPALAIWIWIWIAFFREGGKAYRKVLQEDGRGGRSEITAAALATVAAFLTAGFFEYNFGDSEVVMMVYFLMAPPFLAARSASSDEGLFPRK